MEENAVFYQPNLADIKATNIDGRQSAYRSINTAILLTYWRIGKVISLSKGA